MCLNVVVGLQGGVCVCVCWENSLCYKLRAQLRCEISTLLFAVDAAVNSQYLQLLTAWTEVQQARLMFEKRCVQGHWEVSEDGETRIQSLLPSADEIFRTRIQSSPDAICVLLLSVIICYFVVRYKLCDLWSHRPLKPAALTEASDKLVTLQFLFHSPTSVSQSNSKVKSHYNIENPSHCALISLHQETRQMRVNTKKNKTGFSLSTRKPTNT